MHRSPRLIFTLMIATLAWLTLTAGVAAGEIRVAIGDISGRGGGLRAIGKLQRALRRDDDIAIQSTKAFQRKAKQLRVARYIPGDARGLADLCDALDLDAVVYAQIDRASRRSRSRIVLVDVYDRQGARIATHEIQAGRRKSIPSAVWTDVARAIEPDLRSLDRRGFSAGRDPVEVVEPVEEIRLDPIPVTAVPEPEPVQPRIRDRRVDPPIDRDLEIINISAGLFFLSRSFDYSVSDDSVAFAEGGIDYSTTLSPGIAVNAEIFPLRAVVRNAAAHLGLGLSFEKAFLSTDQEITDLQGQTRAQTLNTAHHHIRTRLQYRAPLSDSDTAIQLGGHLGLGWIKFKLQDNPEYSGVEAAYFDLGLDTLIPLGSPKIAAKLAIRYLPTADLGDTAQELGGEVSTSGFGFTAGLMGRLVGGLTAELALDYTSLSHDVSGEGRGDRIGEEASDAYTGLRLLMGYAF